MCCTRCCMFWETPEYEITIQIVLRPVIYTTVNVQHFCCVKSPTNRLYGITNI